MSNNNLFLLTGLNETDTNSASAFDPLRLTINIFRFVRDVIVIPAGIVIRQNVSHFAPDLPHQVRYETGSGIRFPAFDNKNLSTCERF